MQNDALFADQKKTRGNAQIQAVHEMQSLRIRRQQIRRIPKISKKDDANDILGKFSFWAVMGSFQLLQSN